MPLRLLVITSRPLITPSLQNGQVVIQPIALRPVRLVRGELESALKKASGPVAVRRLARATPSAVQSALLDAYDVVHFVGHGADDGRLLLEQEDGLADFLSPERAAQMLRGSNARLVVISACHSGKAAQALREAGLPNAIAIDEQYPIEARAAGLFNELFYGALARGRALSEAFRLGVDAVRADNFVGDARPPYDEETGNPLPPWSSRFISFFGDEGALTPAGEHGPYEELHPWAAPDNLPGDDDQMIGREELMVRAIRALDDKRLLTLAGPGGIGKTTLGVEIARWHAERELFSEGVWFVKAEGVKDSARLAEALAQSLNLRLDPTAPWETLQQALARREALLLLDNAEDLLDDMAQGEASALGALGRLLEFAPGLRVIATARQALGLRRWETALDVPELKRDEARRLFLRYAPAEQNFFLRTRDRNSVNQICQTLDDYALALVVAAPQLAEAAMTPARLLSELQQAMLETLNDPHSAGVPERLRSLRASLTLSYRRLSPRARVVFFYLGLLPGGASEQTLAALAGEHYEGPARELVHRNLARWDQGRYNQLAPIRAYAEATRPPKRQQAARLRAAHHFARFASDMDDLLQPLSRRKAAQQIVSQQKTQSLEEIERALNLRALAAFDAERENLPAAVGWAFGAGAWKTVRDLVDNANIYLNLRSAWGEMTALNQLAVEAARREANRSAEGVALNNLGIVYHDQGRWAEAISAYEQSLTIKRALGDRHGEGRTLTNLGNVYQLQGRWAEAISAYEQSLTIKRALGDQHGEGQTLTNMGSVYGQQGRWADAIIAYEQSLPIFRALGDRHGEGTTLMNIGNVYQLQGRWADAISAYEQDLAICRALGDRHGEGQTLNNLGIVYQNQGRWADAIAAYEQDLAICRALGDRHGEGQTLNNLGNVYQLQGRWAEAIIAYEQDLAICRALGDRHGEGKTLTNLGVVYQNQGRWADAISAYEQSLTIKRALGDRHGEGQTLNNLGVVYQNQGRWADAISAYEQSLTIKRALGDRHGEGQTLTNLGVVYQNQGRWADAIAAYEQDLAICRALGDRHGEGLTLANMGRLHDQQGHKERALGLWREALAKLHPDSPDYKTVAGWVSGSG